MSKITIAEALTLAAESQVGKREEGGPNQGRDLQKFFDSDNYDPNGPKPGDSGYAWCAAFVCWCVYQAVRDLKISWNRPVTPGAWAYEAWVRNQNSSVQLIKPHGGDIRRGDIVVFVKSHIGIATGKPDGAGRVATVEGNTNSVGGREGDGVWAKRRPITDIRSVIRIHQGGSVL